MLLKNKNYDGVHLYKKLNNKKCISSYALNVSYKEASTLSFVDKQRNSFALQKSIIDNKLIVSRAFNKDADTVKLSKKANGHGQVTSYNLSISLKEARELHLVDDIRTSTGMCDSVCRIVTKNIVDDKLVISRAFPQTRRRFIFSN